MALKQPPKSCTDHTDCGAQYCSHDCQPRLGKRTFDIPMCGKGNYCDNSIAETSFKLIGSVFNLRRRLSSLSRQGALAVGKGQPIFRRISPFAEFDRPSMSGGQLPWCDKCKQKGGIKLRRLQIRGLRRIGSGRVNFGCGDKLAIQDQGCHGVQQCHKLHNPESYSNIC